MKTIVRRSIESETSELEFGYWDIEEEEFVSLSQMNEEEIEEVAKLLGVSQVGAEAFMMFAESIKELICADLASIWKRLDDAGIE